MATKEESATFDRILPALPRLRASLHREDIAAVSRLLAQNTELMLLAARALEHATDTGLAVRGPALLTLRRAIARVHLGLADPPEPWVAPRGLVRQ